MIKFAANILNKINLQDFFNKISYAAVIFDILFIAFLKVHYNFRFTNKLLWIIFLLTIIHLIYLIIQIVNNFRNLQSSTKVNPYSLRRRIVTAFALVTTVPTIIIAVSSSYFFNYGIRSWFDNKISTVLEQSIIVAESYLVENTIQMRQTALSISEDLNQMYYDLIYDQTLFTKILNTEASMHSLDEALVFQKNTNSILAQTSLNFSLAFTTIPNYLLESASKGEIVEFKVDPTKIRILIKLHDFNDSYLLIGRSIDSKIIDHIDRTNGAAAEYYRIKNQISSMQFQFTLIFILISLVLIIIAIRWGVNIAARIVRPISVLVAAANEVKDGNLNVQVPEDNLSRETLILSVAFNRMFKQLNRQQKDLVIAQRALAWSDVARKVAHEIKNPLTPIQLAADRLHKKFQNEVEDKATFAKYIKTILHHVADITSIVSEFVYFAKLPSPDFKIADIVSFIKESIDARALLNDSIKYNFFSDLEHFSFKFDNTQMNQVLTNLLKNAEEAIDEGHPIVPEIEVNITSISNLLIIEISDNGRGFDPSLMQKATEAYFTTRSKGMGLGLAIVSKIVQDHGGNLEVNNNIQGGAKISLIFPV